MPLLSENDLSGSQVRLLLFGEKLVGRRGVGTEGNFCGGKPRRWGTVEWILCLYGNTRRSFLEQWGGKRVVEQNSGDTALSEDR